MKYNWQRRYEWAFYELYFNVLIFFLSEPFIIMVIFGFYEEKYIRRGKNKTIFEWSQKSESCTLFFLDKFLHNYFDSLTKLFLGLSKFLDVLTKLLWKKKIQKWYQTQIDFILHFLSCCSKQLLSFLITGSWRVAQSSRVTCGEDQSTRQLGLRLRRVLILFKDNCAGISRLCTIAEDPEDTAVLLEPVRTRVPNRQKIRTVRKLHGYF